MRAGVDAGAGYLKVVIVDGEKVAGKGSAACGIDMADACERAFAEALGGAGVARDALGSVAATGGGAESVPGVSVRVSVPRASARAASRLAPGARTLVDVGAEESRAVKCDGKGNVVDFALNDKCAAGAGSFIEAMSRALEVDREELGPLSLKARRAAAMSSQCVVFAESEVVSMIHRRVPVEEIARSVYDAMAGRVASLLSKVKTEPELAVVGGVARDAGFVAALERALGLKPVVPVDPEFAGAYGAALCAAER